MAEAAPPVDGAEDSQPSFQSAFVFSSPGRAKSTKVRAGRTRKGLAADNSFNVTASSLQAPAPPVFSVPAHGAQAGQGKAAETPPAQRLSQANSADEPASPMDIDTPAPFQPAESRFSRDEKDPVQSSAATGPNPSTQPAAHFQFTASAPHSGEQKSPSRKGTFSPRGQASKQQAHKTRQHSQAAGLAGHLNLQMNINAASAGAASSAAGVDQLQASFGRAFGAEDVRQPAHTDPATGPSAQSQAPQPPQQPAADSADSDSCKSSQTGSPPQKRPSPGPPGNSSSAGTSHAGTGRASTPISAWPGLQQDAAQPFVFQARPQATCQPAFGTVPQTTSQPAFGGLPQPAASSTAQQPTPFVNGSTWSSTFSKVAPTSGRPPPGVRAGPAFASAADAAAPLKRAAPTAQAPTATQPARTFMPWPQSNPAEQGQPAATATPQPHVRAFRHAAHKQQQQQQQQQQPCQPPPGLHHRTAGIPPQQDMRFAFAGASAAQPSNAFAAAAASGATFTSHEVQDTTHKMRGNDAFKAKQYEQALNHYKQGVGCLSGSQTSRAEDERRAVLLCNCAAACVQMGRIQEAIQHCSRALQAQPGLVRAHERLITCHQRIGQFEAARAHVKDLHKLPDGRASAVAAQSEVDSLQQRCAQAQAEAQKASTLAAGSKALASLQSLTVQVPEFGLLLMLQADLLMQLDRPAEAVAMLVKAHAAMPKLVSRADDLWIEAQASFWAGNLEAAAGQLEAVADCAAPSREHPSLFEGTGFPVPAVLGPARLQERAAGLRTLLHAKDAGNRAMQQKDYSGALQHYTQALNAEQPPPPAFAAVLHCNRASVHLAKNNLLEAVADAGRAHALNPAYAKAIARLGQIMIQLGRHEAAQSMLQAAQKDYGSRSAVGAARDDWASVASVLRDAEAAVRKRRPVDHFLLLSLPRNGCTDEQVKKAWKLLALRLHPDKALGHCKFSLGLTSSCRPFLAASEVEDRIRGAANRLFTTIGEAQTVLADERGRRRHAAELHVYNNAAGVSSRFPPFAGRSAKPASSGWGTYADHSPWSSYATAAGRQRWNASHAGFH